MNAIAFYFLFCDDSAHFGMRWIVSFYLIIRLKLYPLCDLYNVLVDTLASYYSLHRYYSGKKIDLYDLLVHIFLCSRLLQSIAKILLKTLLESNLKPNIARGLK